MTFGPISWLSENVQFTKLPWPGGVLKSLIPVFQRQRHVHLFELKANLVYKRSSRSAWLGLCLKTKPKRKENVTYSV